MFNKNKLRDELQKHGFTATKAAKAIQISRQTFYNKTDGYSQFRIDEIAALKKLLKLSPERLCEIFFDEQG